MKEAEVVELLARHELVYISTSGHLNFGHQLLAGALAASELSRTWQKHAKSMTNHVADDAWIFAARMTPHEQVADYLEAMFNTDLMLGARAARELPSEFHKHAERFLEQSIAATSPEAVRVRGLFALAALGTPSAIATLRKFSVDTRAEEQHIAQRALAAAGDLDFLRQLLPEVDRMKSAPVKISGGEIRIWETAPLSLRLDLARQRLSECTLGEPVRESLFLLAYERAPNDTEIIEKHFRAARDWTAWQSGLFAMHATSSVRAKELLDEALLEAMTPVDKSHLIRTAALIGINIDLRMAFECATSEPSADEMKDDAAVILSRLVSDVVIKHELPSDLVAVVERELPCSSGDRRIRLWQIATGCKISSIAGYAVSCIEEWGSDLGYACNYFIEQSELRDTARWQLLDLCERGLRNEKKWYEWHAWRALTLVGELGFSVKTAGQLSAMIQRLTRIRRATENNDITSLSSDDAEVLNSTSPKYAKSRLNTCAAQLIQAASQARAFLSEEVLLSLLYFDTDNYDGVAEHLRDALSDLSDAAIDEVLSQLKDSQTRRSGLVAVCARGATQIRIQLLALELSQGYGHPAVMSFVKQAIEACWCKSVCEMVVKVVASIPIWPDVDTQFFWDFARAVGRRIAPDDRAVIEAHIAVARTAFAQRLLELWRDQTSSDRIGLARLHPKHVPLGLE
ncbi:hypothetical protein [Paludibacterium purpuratum]|uniref:hypothetical protein n=1 Tax=Paludibacterium purpuratum TaxID=1144873 RepID=UPI00105F27B0|nr:hypothetical protein [Paludibacterium purpuratum]